MARTREEERAFLLKYIKEHEHLNKDLNNNTDDGHSIFTDVFDDGEEEIWGDEDIECDHDRDHSLNESNNQ